MALSHEGRFTGQPTLLQAIGSDGRSGWFDGYGTLHWGDPYATFVGSVYGDESALTGYGTYAPPINRVAGAQGAWVLAAGSGYSPSDVYSQVLAGHPVIAWISSDWRYHPSSPWVAFDGRRLGWAGPYEHAVVVVGMGGSSLYVFNPWSGRQWVSKSSFESAYASYGRMAVVLS